MTTVKKERAQLILWCLILVPAALIASPLLALAWLYERVEWNWYEIADRHARNEALKDRVLHESQGERK